MGKNRQKGFTLLELIITIGIISLLMAAGISSYTGSSRVSRNTRRQADFEQIRSALEAFRTSSANASYPTTLSQLVPDYLPSLPFDPQTRAAFPTSSYFPTRCVTVNATLANCGGCSNYRYHIQLEAASGTSFLVGTALGVIIQPTAPATLTCN